MGWASPSRAPRLQCLTLRLENKPSVIKKSLSILKVFLVISNETVSEKQQILNSFNDLSKKTSVFLTIYSNFTSK